MWSWNVSVNLTDKFGFKRLEVCCRILELEKKQNLLYYNDKYTENPTRNTQTNKKILPNWKLGSWAKFIDLQTYNLGCNAALSTIPLKIELK